MREVGVINLTCHLASHWASVATWSLTYLTLILSLSLRHLSDLTLAFDFCLAILSFLAFVTSTICLERYWYYL